MVSVGRGYSETRAFAFLAKVSDEKIKQRREISKAVKSLKNKASFLDIGAGAGDTFIETSRYFKESVAIEPGSRMFEILNKNTEKYLAAAGRKNKDITLLESDWDTFYKENSKKYEGYFDLIACVHAIYFFKDIKKEISRMLKFLNDDGKLLIICATGRSQDKDFVHIFRHKLLRTPVVKEAKFSRIKKMFPKNCSEHIISTKLTLENFNSMDKDYLSEKNAPTNYYLKFAFKKFYDQYSAEEKKLLRNYLEKHKLKDGRYMITQKQSIYIITKITKKPYHK